MHIHGCRDAKGTGQGVDPVVVPLEGYLDCTKATAKFTDARRKLAKARRNGRGSAIRKASRNLRAARTARAARCG